MRAARPGACGASNRAADVAGVAITVAIAGSSRSIVAVERESHAAIGQPLVQARDELPHPAAGRRKPPRPALAAVEDRARRQLARRRRVDALHGGLEQPFTRRCAEHAIAPRRDRFVLARASSIASARRRPAGPPCRATRRRQAAIAADVHYGKCSGACSRARGNTGVKSRRRNHELTTSSQTNALAAVSTGP